MKAITLCRTALQFHASSEDERGWGRRPYIERVSFERDANQPPTEKHLEFECHSASHVHKVAVAQIPKLNVYKRVRTI